MSDISTLVFSHIKMDSVVFHLKPNKLLTETETEIHKQLMIPIEFPSKLFFYDNGDIREIPEEENRSSDSQFQFIVPPKKNFFTKLFTMLYKMLCTIAGTIADTIIMLCNMLYNMLHTIITILCTIITILCTNLRKILGMEPREKKKTKNVDNHYIIIFENPSKTIDFLTFIRVICMQFISLSHDLQKKKVKADKDLITFAELLSIELLTISNSYEDPKVIRRALQDTTGFKWSLEEIDSSGNDNTNAHTTGRAVSAQQEEANISQDIKYKSDNRLAFIHQYRALTQNQNSNSAVTNSEAPDDVDLNQSENDGKEKNGQQFEISSVTSNQLPVIITLSQNRVNIALSQNRANITSSQNRANITSSQNRANITSSQNLVIITSNQDSEGSGGRTDANNQALVTITLNQDSVDSDDRDQDPNSTANNDPSSTSDNQNQNQNRNPKGNTIIHYISSTISSQDNTSPIVRKRHLFITSLENKRYNIIDALGTFLKRDPRPHGYQSIAKFAVMSKREGVLFACKSYVPGLSGFIMSIIAIKEAFQFAVQICTIDVARKKVKNTECLSLGSDKPNVSWTERFIEVSDMITAGLYGISLVIIICLNIYGFFTRNDGSLTQSLE